MDIKLVSCKVLRGLGACPVSWTPGCDAQGEGKESHRSVTGGWSRLNHFFSGNPEYEQRNLLSVE